MRDMSGNIKRTFAISDHAELRQEEIYCELNGRKGKHLAWTVRGAGGGEFGIYDNRKEAEAHYKLITSKRRQK